MQVTGYGRFVFIAQWILAVLLPFWILGGRAVLGVDLGWAVFLGFLIAAAMLVGMLVPGFVSLGDREVRQAKAERSGFSSTMTVAWVAAFLAGMALPDGGDDRAYPSALMMWFGISEDASSITFLTLIGVCTVALVVSLVLAIVGISRAARTAA